LQKSPLQGRFAFVEGGDATTGDSVKPLYPNNKNLYPGGTMMKRTVAFLLILTVLVAGVTGCGSTTKVTEQVINLGGIQPMTGGAATFGASGKNGATMAVEEFNTAGGATVDGVKTTINYINEDDAGSPEVGASAAQKLINQDKVIGIIGPLMSKVSLAVALIAQAAGVPMISHGSTATQVTLVGDYIFRACFIDSFQGTVMANYAWNTLKVKTAAVLYDNGNDYNKGLAEYFKAGFEKNGGKVVAFEAFTDEDKTVDYKAQLTKIKATNPEFLYLPNYYAAVALQLKQAREMGLNVPAGGGDGWDSPDLVKIGGAAVEGGVFSNHFSKDDLSPKVQAFVSAYTTKYRAAPDALAALAYDAAGLFLDAFKTAGSIKGSDIRDAMKNTSFSGVAGVYKFDENRDPIKAAVILQIKNGQQTYLTTIQP
jgi:branched-chain amino acid transport system substrate-binding protein